MKARSSGWTATFLLKNPPTLDSAASLTCVAI